MLTVLIGPPGAGKTTAGRRVAASTARPFIDADEASEKWYASVGWSVDRLDRRSAEIGFARAHAEWEPALVAAVTGLITSAQDAVVALGAGHTHVENPEYFDRVRNVLVMADQVVLLRPSTDHEIGCAELRRRCLRDRGHDWVRDGIDWIARWWNDGSDELLATHTVITDGDSSGTTASRITRLCLTS